MAERRMFAKSIVLSDAFLDMPMSARCLYFTLGMLADDDGFVGNPKAVMRQCSATNDDMNVLITKKFIIAFENGVIVMKHWRMNNYLQSDRHKDTSYKEELSMLEYDENGSYRLKNKECIQNVYKMYTQDSIDKISIDKDRIDKENINGNKVASDPYPFNASGMKIPSLEDVKQYCIEHAYTEVIPEKFYDYYSKNGWTIKVKGKSVPMKQWWVSLGQWQTRYLKQDEVEAKKRARDAYAKEIKMREEKQDKITKNNDNIDKLFSEENFNKAKEKYGGLFDGEDGDNKFS